MVLLELGGAFTAALAIAGGQIVDGMGGSSGPIGMRAAGALDGELAYLLGQALRKDTLFSGGALDPTGTLDITDLCALWRRPGLRRRLDGAARGGRQGGAGLLVSVPEPHEIVVSGRLGSGGRPGRDPGSPSADDVAPVSALVPS